ncbi:MAG: peroxiredoxin [Planctomycetota bacterium]|nr:peroxiredoxin [Planctomycetota bacterium]MDA1114575.1 peroxiredoxin [Planctomycetota bacterium]
MAAFVTNPVLAPGNRAPAFTLPTDSGEKVRLTEHRGRWVVLFFLPLALTPSCCLEAKEFQKQADDFMNLGAVVVGVSPSNHVRHSEFREKNKLSFPMLHDRDAKLAIRYGVYRERTTNVRDYLGIVRTTVLIDPAGKVAHLWDNLRVKGHVGRVYARLEAELKS